MRSIFKIACIFFLISILCAGCSRESNKTVKQLTDEAMVLLHQNKIQEALKKGESALKKAEEKYGPESPQTARCMQTMGLIYQADGNAVKAENSYKKALSIFLHKEGDQSLDAAKTMNNLAGFYYTQKKYEQAASLFEESLAIVKKKFQADDPRLQAIEKNIEVCKDRAAGKSLQATGGTENASVPSPARDYVPEKIKQYVIRNFAEKNNIHISDLQPEQPVLILDQGIVFPYKCTQKTDKDASSVNMVILFAAIKNKDKKNAFEFQQTRIVSYDAYMSALKKGGMALLSKEMVKIFPSLYSSSK